MNPKNLDWAKSVNNESLQSQQKSLRTLGTFWVSWEIRKLVRDGCPVLCKHIPVKPYFLPIEQMAMSQNLCLVFSRNFILFPNVIDFARLVRLGTFFVVETEITTQWLRKARRKQVGLWSSISIGAVEKTSLGEVLCTSCRLELLLLSLPVVSWSAWRRSVRFSLVWDGKSSVSNGSNHTHNLWTFILILQICIPWGKLRDGIRIRPFQNMIFHAVKEPCNVFYNLLDAGNDKLWSVITMFDQIVTHWVGGTCKLRSNVLEHI